LGSLSIYAAIIGLSLPFAYLVLSAIAGKSRSRNSIIFPPLVFVSLVLVATSTLLQGAILTYAIYYGEVYVFGSQHPRLFQLFGLAAFVSVITILIALSSFVRKCTIDAVGCVLKREESPNLFGTINKIADQLGARAPDNIVVGLEPNFYVTSCDVDVVGNEDTSLTGETMFVSAPLMRLMSRSEFAAVIGHELAHFLGEDTIYSRKFIPIYAGLGIALEGLASRDVVQKLISIATVPASTVLSFMFDTFERNETAIRRDRENKADEIGAQASSAAVMATTIVKIALFAELWPLLLEENIERLNSSKMTRNLSVALRDTVLYDVQQDAVEEALPQILESTLPHPTDSHPTVRARLAHLGVDPSEITKDMLEIPIDPASALIGNAESSEENLTAFEHKMMIALGLVHLPDDEEDTPDYFLNILYSLAAAVVTADGKTDPAEVKAAETIGQSVVEGFDPVDFRDRCNNPEDIPNIDELSEFIRENAEYGIKKSVFNYLTKIAKAADRTHSNKARLLQKIGNAWSLKYPPD
jgi:Zn-dependent protease with chaperone function